MALKWPIMCWCAVKKLLTQSSPQYQLAVDRRVHFSKCTRPRTDRPTNCIVKALCPGVDCSLYVDDFLICYRSNYIHIIEKHLQRCLNKLLEWADANGFKFSTSKTVCMHFCHLRKHHLDPELFLYGMPIPVVQEVKFLGLIFDCKLSFLPHIRYLKNKSSKALNLKK